jgi:hypothetical protein
VILLVFLALDGVFHADEIHGSGDGGAGGVWRGSGGAPGYIGVFQEPFYLALRELAGGRWFVMPHRMIPQYLRDLAFVLTRRSGGSRDL